MFCTKCGANIPDESAVCPQCGAALGVKNQQTQYAPPTAETTVPPQAAPLSDEDMIAKRIRDNAKICAILWIVVGAVQCISCLGIVAGIWNIIMGIREFKTIETIVPGNRAIYDYYDNAMNNLIIGAVINFVFGLLVGCALSAFEFYIRDQVLKNRKVFGA